MLSLERMTAVYGQKSDTSSSFDASAICDLGMVRTNNEDACGFARLGNIILNHHSKFCGIDAIVAWVADGCGGHDNGEFASYCLDQSFCSDPSRSLDEIFAYANNKIVASKKNALSTCSAIKLYGNGRFEIAHVGDSRIYQINNIGIGLLTKDHSVNVNNRSFLTNAVGEGPKCRTEKFSGELNKGDYVLLCSDGLYGLLPDADIYQSVRYSRNVHDAAERLIRRANDNGGHDNISVVLIKYKQ